MSRQRRERRAAERAQAADGIEAAPAIDVRHAPLWAALLAFLVYAPSIGGGFLYDDTLVVLTNPSIRDLSAPEVILRFEPSRALLNLTWALNYAFGGLAPWHYHLVNVLIHAANAALLATLFTWMAARLGQPAP